MNLFWDRLCWPASLAVRWSWRPLTWWTSREINSRKLKGHANGQMWPVHVINHQWSAAPPRRISPNCQTNLEFHVKTLASWFCLASGDSGAGRLVLQRRLFQQVLPGRDIVRHTSWSACFLGNSMMDWNALPRWAQQSSAFSHLLMELHWLTLLLWDFPKRYHLL